MNSFDGVEFLFCCSNLSCDPSTEDHSFAKEPVDLPSEALELDGMRAHVQRERADSTRSGGGLSDDEGGCGPGPRAPRPNVVAELVVEDGSRDSLDDPRGDSESDDDEGPGAPAVRAPSEWDSLKNCDPAVLERRANEQYCDEPTVDVEFSD